MSHVLQDRGPDERLISFPTMLGLRFYQNSPYNVGHIGRLLEKISNFPLFPTRLQTTVTSQLISSPQFFSLQCPLSSLIVYKRRHFKCFDLWPPRPPPPPPPNLSGSIRSGSRNLYDWIYCKCICAWTFFRRDLNCVVYFKRNAYVRMSVYSSLSSYSA